MDWHQMVTPSGCSRRYFFISLYYINFAMNWLIPMLFGHFILPP